MVGECGANLTRIRCFISWHSHVSSAKSVLAVSPVECKARALKLRRMSDHITTAKIPADTVRASVEKQRDRIKQDLTELVSFNSVHGDPSTKADTQAAKEWVKNALQAADFAVDEHVTDDGSVTLIGNRTGSPDAPTVLLYSHYDVVPAGDSSLWTTDPFALSERDGRWYGRGAADCKGNLVMHLATLRTVQELGGTQLNLKAVIEGSEEQGGEGLERLIRTQPDLFQADIIFIADTGNVAAGTPTLTITLRGTVQATVTVDTLRAPVHSGGFGGPAPDAVAALVRLLDTLRDEHGRTTIDNVDFSATWEGEPYPPEIFRTDAGVLDGVDLMGGPDDTPADLAWARPAISIIGFTSTPVDQAVNAVPARAAAKLNLRVPPGMKASDLADALTAHLKAHVPWGAHLTVDIEEMNDPFRANTDGPAFAALADALSAAYFDAPTVFSGTGGSIPLTTLLAESFPSAELMLFGVEEPLSTIHSPDESVSPDEIISIAIAEALFLLNYT